jgi:hypothetical protein
MNGWLGDSLRRGSNGEEAGSINTSGMPRQASTAPNVGLSPACCHGAQGRMRQVVKLVGSDVVSSDDLPEN